MKFFSTTTKEDTTGRIHHFMFLTFEQCFPFIAYIIVVECFFYTTCDYIKVLKDIEITVFYLHEGEYPYERHFSCTSLRFYILFITKSAHLNIIHKDIEGVSKSS